MNRSLLNRSLLMSVLAVALLGVIVIGCGSSELEDSGTEAPADSLAPPADGTVQGEALRNDSQPVYELNYALFQPDISPLSKVNTEFAREIEQRTQGRVKITIHAGGSLLKAEAMYQGVIDGIADMGNSSTVYDPGAFPMTSIAELPCNVESGWAGSRVYYDFHQKYKPSEWDKVHLLTTASTAGSFQSVGLKKKEIRTLEDWHGVSLRSMDPDIIAAMGGTAKDIPMSELYEAIDKGIVDGQVSHFETYKTWKIGEVCDWVTYNASPTQFSGTWYNFMNREVWESLPQDIQEIISEVSRDYCGEIGKVWDEQAEIGAEFVKSLGKTIYVLPEEECVRWAEAIAPVVDARLSAVAQRLGMAQDEVLEIWQYVLERVEYWNAQQADNGVEPIKDRVSRVIGAM